MKPNRIIKEKSNDILRKHIFNNLELKHEQLFEKVYNKQIKKDILEKQKKELIKKNIENYDSYIKNIDLTNKKINEKITDFKKNLDSKNYQETIKIGKEINIELVRQFNYYTYFYKNKFIAHLSNKLIKNLDSVFRKLDFSKKTKKLSSIINEMEIEVNKMLFMEEVIKKLKIQNKTEIESYLEEINNLLENILHSHKLN